MKKKILSLFLAVAVMVSMLSATPSAFATGGVEDAINAIKNQYPSGSYFTLNGQACVHGAQSVKCPDCGMAGNNACANCSLKSISRANGVPMPAGQGCAHTCLGFATYVLNQVFKKPISGKREIASGGKADPATYSNAKMGDLLYFYRVQENGNLDFRHAAVFISQTPKGIIMYDCNRTGASKVFYGEITYKNLPNVMCKVFRATNYDEVNATAATTTPKAATIQPGLYSLAPMCAPDRRLDVEDGATNTGANVQIWRSNDTAAQQWKIEPVDDGYYKLTSWESGKVLDVANAGTTSGTNVQQCIWTENKAQCWRFTDAGDGYYHISTRLNSDLCLDVNEKEDANGTNVQIWEANTSTAQKWKLFSVTQPAKPDHTHQKGDFQFSEEKHPHYNYYACSLCGINFTDGSTGKRNECTICTPVKAAVGTTSKPVATVNGQSVKVSWDYSGTGEKFDVYLVQAPWGWESIKYRGTTTDRSYIFTNVTPGGYAAFVIARPNTNRMQSGWTDLSVEQPALIQQPAGTSNTAAQQYVDMAVSQVGKKRADYGYKASWCGYFAGWCSKQLGFASIIPPDNSQASNGVTHYKYILNHGGNGVRFYNDRSDMQTGTYLTDRSAYTPQIGDIVLFSWGSRAPAGHLYIDHVAIVQKVENGRIYVVHGNYHSGSISGGIVCGPGCSVCGGASWPLDSEKIYAYARPNWAAIASNTVVTPPASEDEPSKAVENLKPESNCNNGHTWGNWEVTQAASCEQSGLRRRICLVCAQSQEEAITAWEHDYRVDKETDEAVIYVCANCGDSYRKSKESSATTTGSMENFIAIDRYVDGIFRDVGRNDWFRGNVATVYGLGLMKGTGEGSFSPANRMTIAETVTLAARLHSVYHTGVEHFPGYDGGNWYDPYVDYAKDNGIISTNYEYTRPATREEFVYILAQALPEEELANRAGYISFADDGDIIHNGAVDLLTGAGVINGIVDNGQTCFKPNATITRAEAAAIVGRMAQPNTRVGI